jgi:hypothetical protein
MGSLHPLHAAPQFVMLLSARGIPDSVLLQKQQDYFDSLFRITYDPSVAMRFLLWKGQVCSNEH